MIINHLFDKDEYMIPNEIEKISLPEVKLLSGVGKNTIYKLMSQDKFPKNEPMKFLPSLVVWNRSEVIAWRNGTWQPSEMAA